MLCWRHASFISFYYEKKLLKLWKKHILITEVIISFDEFETLLIIKSINAANFMNVENTNELQ